MATAHILSLFKIIYNNCLLSLQVFSRRENHFFDVSQNNPSVSVPWNIKQSKLLVLSYLQ